MTKKIRLTEARKDILEAYRDGREHNRDARTVGKLVDMGLLEPVQNEDDPATLQITNTGLELVGPGEVEYVDYLMWVGAFHYPTFDVFVDEAAERGVCKRLGKIPHELRESFRNPRQVARVFLAHDDGVEGDGFIFGYYIPDCIQYVAASEDDIPVDLVSEEFVQWVDFGMLEDEDDRECGERREGAYLVSLKVGQETDHGYLTTFDEPRSLSFFDPERKHFRGMLRIQYGSEMVDGPAKSLVTPPSVDAVEPLPARTPWAKKEDKAILKTIGKAENRSKAAQIMAYKTGRTKSQILYRFSKLTEKTDE